MKILTIIGLGLTFIFNTGYANAEKLVPFRGDTKVLMVTSFSDYMPFGYLNEQGKSDERLGMLLKRPLDKFLPQIGYKPKYEVFETTEDALQNMHLGKINLFVGAYYSTNIYNDFDFVFPSILNNPVYLIMLPSRIREIHKTADLKKLKGVYNGKEYFGDYMIQNFESLNMKKMDCADDAYEALFTGEADFMLGSYYANYIALVQKGLKNYVSFSSKPLWNMPMFLALSKMTPDLKMVRLKLQKLLGYEEFKNEILQSVKDFIANIEKNSIGIVPPTYINENTKGALTPADEQEALKGK